MNDTDRGHRRRLRRAAVATIAVGLVVAAVVAFASRHEPAASPSATTDAASPIERLRATAESYADAILRGSASQVAAFYSSSCTDRLTDAQLDDVRAGIARVAGTAAAAIVVKGAPVRNFDGSHGEVAVTFDLPAAVQGNDNWLAYRLEAGTWRVVDCNRLPLGGNSTPSGSSGVTAHLELPVLVAPAGTDIHGFLVVSNTTGAPLHVLDGGCTPKWTVVLTNEVVPPSWAFTAECGLAPLDLPTGDTRLPVTIRTTYASCTTVPSDTAVAPSLPLCLHASPPPLPVGDYTTVLVGSIPGVVSPDALPVTLTA